MKGRTKNRFSNRAVQQGISLKGYPGQVLLLCLLLLLKVLAKSIFADTGMQITDQGQRHLGAALGSREFAEGVVAKKVCSWSSEVLALAEIATNRPHAAFVLSLMG